MSIHFHSFALTTQVAEMRFLAGEYNVTSFLDVFEKVYNAHPRRKVLKEYGKFVSGKCVSLPRGIREAGLNERSRCARKRALCQG